MGRLAKGKRSPMSSRRVRRPGVRFRLRHGAAAVALLAAMPAFARAQTQAPEPEQSPTTQVQAAPVVTAPAPTEARMAAGAPPPIVPGAAPQYGALGERGVYLEADQLEQSEDGNAVTARGHVEARYQGRTLRADELFYDRRTGLTRARGHTVVMNPDGTAEFADEAELDDQFRAGIALGFSARLQDNIQIAAARAYRRSEEVQELDQAIFTPCNVCVENGRASAPTFSIEAERVTQDRRRRVIVYRNAVIRVRGVPVMWTPYFAHADPTADRASGLLVPRVRLSNRRGFSYEQPYLWVISPSADLVVSPQINTQVNPFLNLRYRQRFYSGDIDIRVGGTYERDFDSHGDRFGDRTTRSYVLARGDFDWDEDWSYGFAAERVSDDTLFDRYKIRDVYDRRGLYLADSRRLLSQVYAIRQDDRSYLSISALSFQGLRPTDDDRTFPFVAPLIEARWEPNVDIFNGRLRLEGSAVLLERSVGADSRRATAAADWRSSFILSNGLRIDPFAYLRGDIYGVANYTSSRQQSAARGAASVGVDVTWPFIRRAGTSTIVLEPELQVSANAESDIDDRVPNEDSRVFNLDDTNIFRFNRFPGYDRFEDGVIVTAGGRAAWRAADGRSASLFLGRSYRSRQENAFELGSGLRDQSSDWVVQAEATPFAGVTAYARARIDPDDGSIRHREAGLAVSLERVSGVARYFYDESSLFAVTRNDFQVAGQVLLTRRFGLVGNAIYNIDEHALRYSELGLLYLDECVRLEVVYQRENTFNRALGPSSSVEVRLTLATFGGVGNRDYDAR